MNINGNQLSQLKRAIVKFAEDQGIEIYKIEQDGNGHWWAMVPQPQCYIYLGANVVDMSDTYRWRLTDWW